MIGDRIVAAVFDVDGVLTDTAQLHFVAWRELFGEVFAELGDPGEPPFTKADYDRLVDGRPRFDGLVAVLDDRGLSDLPSEALEELGDRKQALYLAAVDRCGVAVFTDVVPCLTALQARELRVAAASASRNAGRNLTAAGLADTFDAVVDGVIAAELGLAGKPAPDLFLEAARRLDVDPGHCVLVEDALAGLEAGVGGGFGLVVGIDRSTDGGRGLEAHADLVVTSLDQLGVDSLVAVR